MYNKIKQALRNIESEELLKILNLIEVELLHRGIR